MPILDDISFFCAEINAITNSDGTVRPKLTFTDELEKFPDSLPSVVSNTKQVFRIPGASRLLTAPFGMGSVVGIPYGYEEFYTDSDYPSLQFLYNANERRTEEDRAAAHKFVAETSEDNTKIVYRVYKRNLFYSKKTNSVSSNIPDSHYRSFILWKKTNKLVQVHGLKKQKLVYSEVDLPLSFLRKVSRYLKNISHKSSKLIEPNITLTFNQLRKALLNPMWADLNSTDCLMDLPSCSPLYSKVRSAYAKGGAKPARELFYGTKNKRLIRYLQDKHLRSVRLVRTILTENPDLNSDKLLAALIKNTLSRPYLEERFLSHLRDVFRYERTTTERPYPKLTAERILSSRGTFTEQAHSAAEYSDIVITLERIRFLSPTAILPVFDNKLSSLGTLSTQLSKLYQELRISVKALPFECAEELAKTYEDSLDGYSFVTPKQPSDLRDCGNSMSICVGSYDERLRSRQLDIVFIKQDDKHIACLEIRNKALHQAKLERNKRISTDEALTEVLKKWAEPRGIDISCNDTTPRPERGDFNGWQYF